MKKNQAGGYIFESVIWRLLKKSGYIAVSERRIKGRGAYHQIDASGILSIPTPFIYPIRLICEAKYHTSHKVGLSHIRNFVGVIKDISENYIIEKPGNGNKKRNTDAGCFFSVSPFTPKAQNYAWAHNIFIVSFNEIAELGFIIREIVNFLNNYNFNQDGITKKKIVKDFWGINKENDNLRIGLKNTVLIVGILNKIYPIVLTSHANLVKSIKKKSSLETDNIRATKTSRESGKLDTRFHLRFQEFDQIAAFSLPNTIANKIIKNIDRSSPGDKIFEIDIPFIINRRGESIRRFFKIDVNLPEKESYLRDIKKKNQKNKPMKNKNRFFSGFLV